MYGLQSSSQKFLSLQIAHKTDTFTIFALQVQPCTLDKHPPPVWRYKCRLYKSSFSEEQVVSTTLTIHIIASLRLCVRGTSALSVS